SSRRRHTSFSRDWSSDVCSSDLGEFAGLFLRKIGVWRHGIGTPVARTSFDDFTGQEFDGTWVFSIFLRNIDQGRTNRLGVFLMTGTAVKGAVEFLRLRIFQTAAPLGKYARQVFRRLYIVECRNPPGFFHRFILLVADVDPVVHPGIIPVETLVVGGDNVYHGRLVTYLYGQGS